MTIGASRTYYQKWRFKVVVDGLDGEAFFQKAGPLEVEVAVSEYRGGGAIIPHKEAGSATFAAISLERGSTEDQVLYDWFRTVVFAAGNSGLNQEYYKRNVTILQLDRTGTPVKYYDLYDCFPKKYSAGEWDGNATGEFSMESIELEYSYFEQLTIPNPG